MHDLLWAILIIGVLSAILLVAMLRISRWLPNRLSNLLAIFIVTMMFTYALLVHDKVWLTHILPVSNVIVLGNISPLLVAAFAGLIWRRVPPPTIRRVLVIGILVIVCLYTIYRPVGSSRVDLQACKLEYSIVSPK